MERRTLRRAPASLAGDDFIGIGRPIDRANQNRLQEAVLADRGRQFLERGFVEMPARLELARSQERHRQRRPGCRHGLGRRRDFRAG